MDSPKACNKVAWHVLTQRKSAGGLGLVNPERKAQILHARWVIKALSPSEFPWKPYLMHKIEQAQAVSNGQKNAAYLLSTKPD